MKSLDRGSQEAILEENLRLVFSTIPQLTYILFEERLKSEEPHFLFLQNLPFSQNFGQKLSLIPKQKIISPLMIRAAQEEDHDDLTAICDSQSELQTSEHGHFFIAEMIASQNEEKICLVAENEEGRVVGMMLVSLRMDLSILDQSFDLGPFGLFCKGDFCESVRSLQRQKIEEKMLKEEISKLLFEERVKVLKRLCSYQQNVRLLQEFVENGFNEHLADFKVFQDDPEKKRALSNLILGKLVDKHLKQYRMSNPDSIFAEVNDSEIQTLVLTNREFLFRILQHFGLPEGYFEGEGHWKFWAERQIKKKLEDERNKRLFGKRRVIAPKKKRREDAKANEILLPGGFDIEPFLDAVTKFIGTGLNTRHKVAQYFLENEKLLLKLFCEENGELDEDKTLEFETVIEYLQSQTGGLAINFKKILIPVLVCFGSLDYTISIREDKDKREFKFSQSKDKDKSLQSSLLKTPKNFSPKFQRNQKKIHHVTLKSILTAVEQILNEDNFFKSREYCLHELDQNFREEEGKAISEVKDQYEQMGLSHYNSIKATGVEQAIEEVSAELLNAACINIFFMEESYSRRAVDFLPFVFNRVQDRDFLILTQPQLANETPLLSHFELVPHRPDSNFGHSLYFFHRSNLFSQFLKVLPAMPDEIEYLDRKMFQIIENDPEEMRQMMHNKLRNPGQKEEIIKEIFKMKTKKKTKTVAPTSTKIVLRLRDLISENSNKASCKWGRSKDKKVFCFDMKGKLTGSSPTIENKKNIVRKQRRKSFAQRLQNKLKKTNLSERKSLAPNNCLSTHDTFSHNGKAITIILRGFTTCFMIYIITIKPVNSIISFN